MTRRQTQRRDSIALIALLIIGFAILGYLIIAGSMSEASGQADDAGSQGSDRLTSDLREAGNRRSNENPSPTFHEVSDKGDHGSENQDERHDIPQLIRQPLSGPTAFVRRLQYGEILHHAQAAWKAGEIDNQQAGDLIAGYAHHLLTVDGVDAASIVSSRPPRGPMAKNNIQYFFSLLTAPARSLSRLNVTTEKHRTCKLSMPFVLEHVAPAKVASVPVHDVIEDSSVRVWTLGDDVDDEVIRSTSRTIQGIIDSIAVNYPNGFDILLTPEIGQDVFPTRLPIAGAQGLYYIRDGFAVVDAFLTRRDMDAVMKHELVHAICYQLADDFESSRFISEGLAESLRLVRPTARIAKLEIDDMVRPSAKNIEYVRLLNRAALNYESALNKQATMRGLEIAPEMIANELAWLENLLENIPEVDAALKEHGLGRVLDLSDADFYGLNALGYLLSQASLVYVEHSLVRDALQTRSDREIATALRTINMKAFRAWISKFARFGSLRLAKNVQDRVLRGNHRGSISSSPIRRVLRQIGAKIGDDAYPLEGVFDQQIDPLERLTKIATSKRRTNRSLRRVSNATVNAASGEDLIVFTTFTSALDGAFELKNLNNDTFRRLSNVNLSSDSKLGFVNALIQGLDQQKQGKRLVSMSVEHTPRQVVPPVSSVDLETFGQEAPLFYFLPPWLAQKGYERNARLVILVNERFSGERLAIRDKYGSQINAPHLTTNEERNAVEEELLAMAWEGQLRASRISPSSVLIVSLNNGQDDAHVVQQAFMNLMGNRSHNVALWNPQAGDE